MAVYVVLGSLFLCFNAEVWAVPENTDNGVNAESPHAHIITKKNETELEKFLLEENKYLKTQNSFLMRMLLECEKEEKPETPRPCKEPETPLDLPHNCMEVKQRHPTSTNGVYQINAGSDTNPVPVYCDMETDGGGWTIIQRRQDGSANFYRNYADYAAGFGDLEGEFWLGNELIHTLTKDKDQEVRFDLQDFENTARYAKYDTFYVDSAYQSFKLEINGYTGDAGDSMTRHNGMKFSTFDMDNDKDSRNCAKLYDGAWWYVNCHDSNLNGRYLRGNHGSYANGVNWRFWHGYNYSLKKTEIKVRPKN